MLVLGPVAGRLPVHRARSLAYPAGAAAARRRAGRPARSPAARRQEAPARRRWPRGRREGSRWREEARPHRESGRRRRRPGRAQGQRRRRDPAPGARARGRARRAAPRTPGARAPRRLVRRDRASLTWPGEMGEDEARAAGLEPGSSAPSPAAAATWPCELERSRRSAAHLLRGFRAHHAGRHRAGGARPGRAGVDLILFAGGDGTARDICARHGRRRARSSACRPA